MKQRGRKGGILLAMCLLMLSMVILPQQSVQAQSKAAKAVTKDIQEGWYTWSDGTRSYYRNGDWLTGWQVLGGYRFYFDKYGDTVSGWQTLGGQRYYFNKYGRAMTGFQEISGYRFYLNQYGRALSGWQTVNGKRYYLNSYGRVLTGFQKIGNYRYYLHTKYGYAFTGWNTISGNRYYFNSAGQAATGTRVINGTRYTFNSYGRVISSGGNTNTNPVVYRAVVFGEANYGYNANSLPACRNDANGMYRMLLKTGYSKVDGGINASKSDIKSLITKTFASADSNDVSLFYYSGHGMDNGSLYCVDGNSISTAELASWLKNVPGHVIVLLDSCFSGAVINKAASADSFNQNVINAFRSVDSVVEGNAKSGEMCTSKFKVITACSKYEYSYCNSSFSYFTNAFVEGAGYDYNGTRSSSAPADSNKDGKLSVYELYRYTYYDDYCYGRQSVRMYSSDNNFKVLQR